jgi:transposase
MLDEFTAVTGFHGKHATRLRRGRIYSGKSSCGGRHARWLAEQAFAHPAHHIALQEALNPREVWPEQVTRLEAALVEIVSTWPMAPVVDAFQAMRGVGFVAAVIIVAELGDLRRFDHLTKDEKHTGRLRNSDHLRAFSARAGAGAGVMIGLSR